MDIHIFNEFGLYSPAIKLSELRCVQNCSLVTYKDSATDPRSNLVIR